MGNLQIKQIKNLLQVDIIHLIEESRKEGFNFLLKLINEYKNKTNTFSKRGECLYGIFQGDALIGIGGINQDPYAKVKAIGRLRRFYISKECRRKGLGNLLLKRILSDAKEHFQIVVLYTDTKQASQFYISNGFMKSERYQGSTHYLRL
ncbi:GNAT family N-acetyltransferase [Bacillus arachidis]|uniref:GNAT family N-acetyltransferase n=1 Tax=Bacillus arachidis TaxID=2819290 RepID=A0ABS3NYL7_9BACI|nr:GNAT family N-acetyltransferase [Bacillus arachidis]MBO1625650.1 GNAT family N-acetyltransferase [Bacillus arachidis]